MGQPLLKLTLCVCVLCCVCCVCVRGGGSRGKGKLEGSYSSHLVFWTPPPERAYNKDLVNKTQAYPPFLLKCVILADVSINVVGAKLHICLTSQICHQRRAFFPPRKKSYYYCIKGSGIWQRITLFQMT